MTIAPDLPVFRTTDMERDPVTEIKSPEDVLEAMLQSAEGGEMHVRPLLALQESGRFARYVDVGLALRRAFRAPAQRDYFIARMKPHLRYVIGLLPAGIQRHGMLPAEPAQPQSGQLRLEDVSDAELQQWLVDDGSLIYGEMKRYELQNYFDAIAPYLKPGGRMIDLGSGLGKVVLTAALTMPFSHCAGVELMGYRHAMAQERLDRLLALARHEAAEGRWDDLGSRIQLTEGDMFKADVSDASLVFIYSTCFAPLMDALAARLASVVPEGTLVSCTTFPMTHPAFRLVRHFPAQTIAWTGVFLYQRTGQPDGAYVAPPAYMYQPDRDEWEVLARAECAAYDASA